MPMNLLMTLDPRSKQSMNATISSEERSLSKMKCDSRRDDLEEFPVEFFEPGRRLLVGLPEQAEQGIERAAIRPLNDLDSNVDPCRAAPELLPEGMPPAALQRGKVGVLAAHRELDDGARKAGHPEQPPSLGEQFEICGLRRGEILPDQQCSPQHARLRFERLLQRKQGAPRVDASQHPH